MLFEVQCITASEFASEDKRMRRPEDMRDGRWRYWEVESRESVAAERSAARSWHSPRALIDDVATHQSDRGERAERLAFFSPSSSSLSATSHDTEDQHTGSGSRSDHGSRTGFRRWEKPTLLDVSLNGPIEEITSPKVSSLTVDLAKNIQGGPNWTGPRNEANNFRSAARIFTIFGRKHSYLIVNIST